MGYGHPEVKGEEPPSFTSWILWFDVNKNHSSSNIYWEHTLGQALRQALCSTELCLRISSSICRIYAWVMCELISQINLLLNFQMLPARAINMCSQLPQEHLPSRAYCLRVFSNGHSRYLSHRTSTLPLHFCEVQVDVSLQPGMRFFPEWDKKILVVERGFC